MLKMEENKTVEKLRKELRLAEILNRAREQVKENKND